MQITKTSFLSFLQCPKAFWLFQFEPTSAAPPDLSAQRRLRMGQEVDQHARAAFPDGTHIPYRPNPTDQAQLTAEAIADGATTLFQATASIVLHLPYETRLRPVPPNLTPLHPYHH